MSMVIPEDTKRKYESYPKYKGSGVEWLGEIPAHWEVKPLKRVLKVFNGSTPKSSEPEYWDGDIPWVTPEDLGELASVEISGTKRYITQAGYESCGTNLVPTGSLVLSTRAPIGHLAIAAVALCTNQGCRALVPRSNIRSRFSYYVLYASRQELVSLGQGSTFMELGKPELETLIFPFPKTEEQQAIADFLDEETSRIDELIAKKQRLIELLQEQRTALITHTGTKGLNPDVPLKDSGVEWLGDIPKHWAVKKLSWIFEVKGRIGWRGYTTQDLRDADDGVLVLGATNINRNGQIDLSNPTYISKEKYEESPEIKLFGGEILIVKVGATIGKVGLVPDDFVESTINPNLMLARSKEVNSHYYHYLFNSKIMQEAIGLEKMAGAQDAINQEFVNSIRILFPPTSEQQAITDYLDRETFRIDTLIDRINQAIEKLQEYRSALITAAVTGKIDVRQYVI